MSFLQIRIDPQQKKEAQRVLEDIGLTLSSAVKIFLQRVVTKKELPFSISGETISKPGRKPGKKNNITTKKNEKVERKIEPEMVDALPSENITEEVIEIESVSLEEPLEKAITEGLDLVSDSETPEKNISEAPKNTTEEPPRRRFQNLFGQSE